MNLPSQFSLSLKSRQIMIFVGIIVLVLPVIFMSIEQAFKQSQITALEQQLEAHLYTIIGEIDFDAEEVNVTGGFLPPILNQVESGTLALVEQNQNVIWRSDSALGFEPQITARPQQSGEELFQFEQGFWRYSYGLFYESENGTQNLMVHVLQSKSVLEQQLSGFRNIIIRWFLLVTLLLVVALAVGLWSTLKPISRLDSQIKAVEKGKSQFIEGDFPTELARVKEDLNLLISAQDRQKNRYRSSLSDLTHALKTPVAVLRSSEVCDNPTVTEQLDRMTNIIEHQLRRAATGGEDVWKKKAQVSPSVDKLLSVMGKIHADRTLTLEHNSNDEAHFYGDEADLLEILGNLIDNACKACKSQVNVTITIDNGLTLIVEDDGPGVPEQQRSQLLVRGERLDTYSDGHGVGMAIVNDLVNSYQGTLEIGESALGGAKFGVHFDQ